MALKVQNALYEQAMADFIILLSPFSPSFASELWSGLTSVPSLSSLYRWVNALFSKHVCRFCVNTMVIQNDHYLLLVIHPLFFSLILLVTLESLTNPVAVRSRSAHAWILPPHGPEDLPRTIMLSPIV